MKRYRLYIDESGTHNYCISDNIKKKYLCLCGVIIGSEILENELNPYFYKLKQFISNDKDEFPVFHREDIVGGNDCFSRLEEPQIKQEWKNRILWLFNNLEYIICGVVLDKKHHFLMYEKAAKHPYHYCLDVLLERYVFFLSSHGAYGDVVAETRGKKEDRALTAVFENFYDNGTWYLDPNKIKRYLSSKRIKIKSKGQGYWGLELADLLALAVKLDILYTHGKLNKLKNNFNLKIIEVIQSKYRKNNDGKVIGFGKKLIE